MNIKTGKLIPPEEFGILVEKKVKPLAKGPLLSDFIPVKRELTEKELKEMKIGRNSSCGCGSGKRFKRCCMGKKNED